MKQIRHLFLAAILALGTLSSVFAVEKTLIDFNAYEEKIASDGYYQKERGDGKLDESMLPQYNITVDDMKIDKWIVELNSSAQSVKTKIYSMSKAVKTKGLVGGSPRTVLGARVHFPQWPFAAYAKITPPFEFPTYKTDGKFANLENGLVENTGQVYQLSVEVNGRNYNNALIVTLKNEFDEEEEYFMGYLFFQGWRRLIWKNPNYITNVDLREIMRLPLYPKSIPYKKLVNFVVYRPGDQWGGDFVIYIANIKIAYDLAILEEESDIDDESVWNIIQDRSKEKQARENKINAELLDLRMREMKKMHAGQHKPAEQTGDKPAEGGQTQTQQ